MKIYAEIYPSKNLLNLKELIAGMEIFDGFNIPDNPLGYPTMPPELIGYIIRQTFPQKEIIINQRLKDINELKLRSVITAAKAINASVIFTQGDSPRYGKEYNEIDSTYAMKLALRRGAKSGLILSFRRPVGDILARMELNAALFLVINFENISILEKMNTERLVPYIIVKTEKNGGILEKINQSSVELEDLHIYMDKLNKFPLKGILFSVPGDNETLMNIKNYF
jgi:5,10-methylenetetrahydrofolate reductase